MLTATRAADRLTAHAWEQEKADGPWACPACGEPVILKRGRQVTAHFAHKPGSACGLAGGESTEHRQCKYELFETLSNDSRVTRLALERGLGSVRPDLSAYVNGAPVAIEVQISNLSMDEIARRTVEYHRKKIAVLWLAMWRDDLKADRISPRPWQRWLHAANFGRIFYWSPGMGTKVNPVRFDPYIIEVPASYWYEGGQEQSGGGYSYPSKRWRTPVVEWIVDIVSDMAVVRRHPWQGGEVTIPACTLWTTTRRQAR